MLNILLGNLALGGSIILRLILGRQVVRMGNRWNCLMMDLGPVGVEFSFLSLLEIQNS